MAYKVGDKVAHPLHGAGIISDIQSKRINGTTRDYYALDIMTGSILVLVPVDSSDIVGLRPIVSQDEAEAVLVQYRRLRTKMMSTGTSAIATIC